MFEFISGFLVAAALVLTFIASLAEASYLVVSPVDIHERMKAGDKRAKHVLKLLEEKPKLISTAVFLEVLSNVVLAILVGNAMSSYLGPLGLAIGVIIVTFSEAVFFTLLPMTLGIGSATTTALDLASMLVVLDRVLGPVTVPLTRFAQKIAGKISKDGKQGVEEEFESYVEMMVEQGDLLHEAGIVVNNALKGSKLLARDIAVPISGIVSVKDTDSVSNVLRAMGSSKHQRLPVVDASGEVVGAVSFRSLAKALANGMFDASVSSYVYDPPTVKTTANLYYVLDAMNSTGVAVAFVYEDARFYGMVSLTSVINALLKLRSETS